jgi:hypothetical protein
MVYISAMLLAMGVPVAKTTPPPPFLDLDMPHFQETYRRRVPLAVCGNPAMRVIFADVKKIFEIMGLVHKQPVHAKFLKCQRVVFFSWLATKGFEFGFQPFLGLFNLLHDAPVVRARFCSRFHFFQFIQLFPEKTNLGFFGQRDPSQSLNGSR